MLMKLGIVYLQLEIWFTNTVQYDLMVHTTCDMSKHQLRFLQNASCNQLNISLMAFIYEDKILKAKNTRLQIKNKGQQTIIENESLPDCKTLDLLN